MSSGRHWNDDGRHSTTPVQRGNSGFSAGGYSPAHEHSERLTNPGMFNKSNSRGRIRSPGRGYGAAMTAPGDEPKPERSPFFDHAPPKRMYSAFHIFVITSFNFIYSFIVAGFGLVVLPAEAARLWPSANSLFLGIMLVTIGVSQLICPAAGYMSDNWNSKWGRRRPFLILGVLIFIQGMAGMAFASAMKMGFGYLLGLAVANFGLNVAYTANTAILPDIVSEEQMGLASGISAVQGLLGSASTFIFVIVLKDSGQQPIYLCYLAGAILVTIVVCLVAKEQSSEHMPKNKGGVLAKIRKVFSDPAERDFLRVLISRIFYYYGISVTSFLLFYLRDACNINPEERRKEWIAYISLTGQLVGVACALPLGKISENPNVGRKKLVYWASFMMFTAYVAFLMEPMVESMFGQWVGRASLLAGAAFFGAGSGAFQAVDLAIAIDVMPNKEESASALGVWSVSYFVGSAIGPAISGVLLEFLRTDNKKEGEETRYAFFGYFLILIMGGCSAILAGVVTSRIKNTT